jgi:hypothetical protein
VTRITTDFEGVDKIRKDASGAHLCTRIGRLSYGRRCDENCTNPAA